ncbi:hypothetical protein CsatB_001174 [Cannabis sativa]
MVSEDNSHISTMARPSTRSQDGILPSNSDPVQLQQEAIPDIASVPNQPPAVPRRSSRTRPQPGPDSSPNNSRPSQDRGSIEDASSPFFLSSGDHPGLVLVSSILTGANYQSWKRGITMALAAKNKTAFIDGSIPRPIAGNSLNSWLRCNNMVMSWLVNSVSPDIAQSIMYFDNAAEMWQDLAERFNEANGPRIFQLQTQLTSLHQGDQSVTSYFTKLKSLWDELKEFQPNTPCTCGAMKVFLDHYNQSQVLQFLTGLNESYASVRAQILLNEPIPNLSRVFSMIVQEERQRTLGTSNITALASSVRPSSSTNPPRNKKPRPSCSNCGKPGHLVDKCFFIHGFPPGYGDKRKNDKGKNLAPQASANLTAAEPSTNQVHIDLSTQCQQLISLLSQQLTQNAPSADPQVPAAASNMAGTLSESGDWDC